MTFGQDLLGKKNTPIFQAQAQCRLKEPESHIQ